MTVSMRIEGAEEAAAKVGKLADSIPPNLDELVYLAAQRIVGRTSKYPPPIPDSSYQRTGIYGKTFSLQRLGHARVEMTSNAVQKGRGYSPWVGGGERGRQQAAVHVGRWPVFFNETVTETKQLAKDIDQMVNVQAGKAGL